MGTNLYPLSPELRAHFEAVAASAEPYEDMDEDDFILDDKSPRALASNARFILRQDDKARAAAASQDTP